MFIPVRLPNNAFDLSRPAKEVMPPHGKAAGRRDPLSTEPAWPAFPPGLRDVGGELDRLLTRLAPGASSRRSHAELGLDKAGQAEKARASLLASNGQLNPDNTSYEKVHLTFGASTSVGKLSGTYAGTGAAASATRLTIALDAGATVSGSDSAIAFSVRDQGGATLFSYAGTAKAGDSISLGSELGLAITFSEGTLVAGQSAQTGVSRVVPTEIDMNARFGDDNPNLRPRFAAGLGVGAGSFAVNGTTISVGLGDSVASVLRRINELVPRVVASFSGDRVELATRDHTRQPIVVSDDTSGFVAAAKLAGVESKPGAINPREELLGDGRRFANVRAGSFSIAGQTITVDPQRDSVASLLARISANVPGLSAYYDDEADTVVVRGGETALSFGEDSSGFLAALGLDGPRTLAPRESMTLPPGTAARLERAAQIRNGELVSRTLAALAEAAAWPPEEEVAALAGFTTGAQGAAAKAKLAYGRDAAEQLRRTGREEPTREPLRNISQRSAGKAAPERAGWGAPAFKARGYGFSTGLPRTAESVADSG